MKKLFAYAALALAGTTHAAGVYDGIYASPNSSTRYASIHQSGSAMIVAIFDTTTVPTILFSSPGGVVRANRFDYWDLYTGSISGNIAALTGQTAFGNCAMSMQVTFTSSAATFTASAMSNTSLGNANGTNCPGISQGNSLTFQKVY